MKQLTILLPLFFYVSASAQKLSPALQSLVNAENGFAMASRNSDTRSAFLSNLAGDGIVFSKGSPVNGKELWGKRDPNNSLLFWWPVYADISAAGDFGYTTGPFEWSKSRSDTATAFGYYSSVWKKDVKALH